MTIGFIQARWSDYVVCTLAQCGVTHAVVSPGSRSTPIVAALSRLTNIVVHVAIDERSAGFIGLGLARGLAQPVLLVCTSGTAAANYLPAIVESNLAGVPLIALTADRPLELQHAGAPQSIDQTHLFGMHVRRFLELGECPPHVRSLPAFRRLLMDAVRVALAPHPGPVHLNFRARKPLEPSPSADSSDVEFDQCVRALLAEPVAPATGVEIQTSNEHLHPIAEVCAKHRRGLILCGFDAEQPVLESESLASFARATGYPIWLDASHPLRWNHPDSLSQHVVRCADLLWLVDDFVLQFRPHLVVQVGPMITSATLERWLSQVGAEEHVVISRQGWPDPIGRSRYLASGQPGRVLTSLARIINENRGVLLGERPWFLDWQTADTQCEKLLQGWLSEHSGASRGELALVQSALTACPARSQVVLGNSLPVRESGLVVPAGNRKLHAYANRGANGIDGVLSTAVGLAWATSRPTLVLLGDISFLHDLGALWAARGVTSPLAIVVLDNRGGRIFEQLPVSDSMNADQLRLWTTPHELDLWAAGLLYGIETVRPAGTDALRAAVADAMSEPRCTLMHVLTEPDSARLEVASLGRSIEANLF